MCNFEKKCEKPENLRGKPSECSEEQIEQCHGDVKGHPCRKDKEKPDGKEQR